MNPQKKKSFLKRHKEAIKIFGSAGISLLGIVAIIAGIVAHLINPAMGFVTVPLGFQALITVLVNKFPEKIEDISKKVHKVLENEDQEKVTFFVDNVILKFGHHSSSFRAQTNEPLSSQDTISTPCS